MPSQAVMEPETESIAPEKPLYERDFYTWTREQAAALSEGRLQDLDLANLAEEIASMGTQEFNQLASAYRVILIHMLKWDHQPARRARSWVTSIRTQRIDAAYVLKDNPGLKSRLAEAIERGYSGARVRAAGETGLPEKTFFATCPYTLDEIMSRPFEWPEA
jgi:hypothetical protein